MTLCSYCLTKFSSELPTYTLPEAAPLDLLSSNNPLGAQEAQGVRDRIADASLKLQSIDSKIEKIRSLLSEYEATRETFENYVNRHKGLLSPVHSVPSEIWSEVFQWVQIDRDRKETPSLFSKPLQLCSYGAVSSLWRNVTTGTPHLWTNIKISEILPKGAYELLDLSLLRSNCCPLIVSICAEELDKDDYKIFSDCVKSLMVHGNRWKALRIEISNDYRRELQEILVQGLVSAPIMKACTLRIEEEYDVPIVINAPLLKHVKLYLNNQKSFMPWLLPLSFVTNLELFHTDLFTADELADYLRACPHLEHLSVASEDYDVNLLPSLTHYALKTLSIYKGCSIIFSGLVAPAMNSLTLRCTLEIAPDDRLRTIQFIRNNPNLKSLSLDQNFLLLQYGDFQDITQITELVLSGTGHTEFNLPDVLEIFASPDVLPKTTSLVINLDLAYSELYFKLDRVRDIILDICQNRMQGRSTNQTLLQQINVNLSAALTDIDTVRKVVDVDSVLGLANMGVEGLNVELALTDGLDGDV